jgi:hypothetical protein
MAGKPEDSWEPAARRFRDIETAQRTFVETIVDIVLGPDEPTQKDFALDA